MTDDVLRALAELRGEVRLLRERLLQVERGNLVRANWITLGGASNGFDAGIRIPSTRPGAPSAKLWLARGAPTFQGTAVYQPAPFEGSDGQSPSWRATIDGTTAVVIGGGTALNLAIDGTYPGTAFTILDRDSAATVPVRSLILAHNSLLIPAADFTLAANGFDLTIGYSVPAGTLWVVAAELKVTT